MTATRWWVRLAARWLARIDGVSAQLRLAMLALTGLSTATLSLQSYGYGHLAIPLIAVVTVLGTVYTYLYTEGGVWNQMGRDRQDLSANWAGPNSAIQGVMTARSMAAARKGEELTDAERKAVDREMLDAFETYRDGVEIENNGDL
jgi:hypothetical protein